MSPPTEFDMIRKKTSKGKAVRFADHEGYRLCEVFHIHRHNDDINDEKKTSLRTEARAKPNTLQVVNSPWSQDMLSQRLKTRSVTLENVVKTEKGIIGITAVKNIAYHKDVIVRYSFNDWRTVSETTATFYKQDSPYQIDYFVFVVNCKTTCFDKKWDVNFAICYKVNGQEYWDNNDGENYHIKS